MASTVARLDDGLGRCVAIEVVGYQFPDIHDERWDANWLIVQLDVSDGTRRWSRRDPAILTFELESLVDGLKSLAARESTQFRWHGLEPCLAIDAETHGARHDLRVRLAHEFAPPDVDPINDPAIVEFGLDEGAVVAFADALNGYLVAFPIRT